MGYHWIKITIIMEQRQSFHDAESSDNYIDCFSDRNTGFSKDSVVLSALNSDIIATDLAKWESAKQTLGSFIILIRFETLKDLCED